MRGDLMAGDDTGVDEIDQHLDVALHELAEVPNYNAWQIELVGPILGGDLLEVGAGQGTFTGELAARSRSVVACEPSRRAFALLAAAREHPTIELVHGVVGDVPADRRFDATVMLNVLEHIEDDVAALREVYERTRPGGSIAIFSPAFPVLLSRFDRDVGHFHRYTRAELRQRLTAAGWEVSTLHYVNMPGFFAWLLVARLLGRRPTMSSLSRWYDRWMIPPIRWIERRRAMPFGQSVLAIARRPDPPTS